MKYFLRDQQLKSSKHLFVNTRIRIAKTESGAFHNLGFDCV